MSDNLWMQGRQALQESDWQGAVAAYTTLLRQDPGALSAYLQRHIAFKNLERHDEAESDLEHVINLTDVCPDVVTEATSPVLCARADACYHMAVHMIGVRKEVDWGLSHLTLAIDVMELLYDAFPPQYAAKLATLYFNRGGVEARLKQGYAHAIEDFTHGIDVCLAELEHPIRTQYQADMQRLLRVGHLNRAKAYATTDELNAAKVDFLEAGGFTGYAEIGFMYYQHGQICKAQRYLELAMKEPHTPCAVSTTAANLLMQLRTTKDSRNN